MNKLRQTQFKTIFIFLCLITLGAYGQKQTKTYTETFDVSEDAILNINISHSDIEFETWNKNQVVVEAYIEIEGATDEEAKRYFENEPIEIIGNSKKVKISTKGGKSGVFENEIGDHHNFHIELPELPEIEGFHFDFDFEELSNMPVLPLLSTQKFDYKAFKKEGDVYLKKWQKEFEKGFDKKHQKKLEEWSKRMAVRQEKMAERHEKLMEKRANMLEKRTEAQAKRLTKLAESRVHRQEALNERRARRVEIHRNRGGGKDSTDHLFIHSNRMHHNRPSIFYRSSSDGHKNYKVKKTLKIKMPKSMKIKMNVRHGEVKLAENTKNINATLSHANLFAATIDGDKTTIMASYTPVSVQQWNYGQLQANYSELVNLKEVQNLRMNATSSYVVINHLENSALIKNDFGRLTINSVSNNFNEINISLQNSELGMKKPATPFTLHVEGTLSTFTCPANITLDRSKNQNTIVHNGYHINKKSDRSIEINSAYSEVVLH